MGNARASRTPHGEGETLKAEWNRGEPRGEEEIESSPQNDPHSLVHKVCLNPILWGVLPTQHS
jgi:hypothetical protein